MIQKTKDASILIRYKPHHITTCYLFDFFKKLQVFSCPTQRTVRSMKFECHMTNFRIYQRRMLGIFLFTNI